MSNLSNDKVPSPCTNNCSLNEKEICVGCYRSISEIITWVNQTKNQKKEILDRCLKRKIDLISL